MGLHNPVKIGCLSLQGNLFLAPVAGYTDRVFRSLCIEYGADFTFTELVSSEALSRNSAKTLPLLERAANETRYGIQLFGSDPAVMARAVAALAPFRPSVIDINAGCPVPKVVKTGAGAALMKTPVLFGKIVAAVVKAAGGLSPGEGAVPDGGGCPRWRGLSPGEGPVHGRGACPRWRGLSPGEGPVPGGGGCPPARGLSPGEGPVPGRGACPRWRGLSPGEGPVPGGGGCPPARGLSPGEGAVPGRGACPLMEGPVPQWRGLPPGEGPVPGGVCPRQEGLSPEEPVSVTVKIRSGWDASSLNYLECAKIAREEGASMATLHARTRAQGYGGTADWEHIACLARELAIPVCGSGDLFTASDAERMLTETRCAAVMFARGALGNPFIFEETRLLLEKKPYTPPPPEKYVETALAHLRSAVAIVGEEAACRAMRAHFCRYLKGIPQAAAIRDRVVRAKTLREYEDALIPLESGAHHVRGGDFPLSEI